MSIPIKKLLAEGFGTAILVFVGCGSVAIGSYGAAAPVGALPIALAFGLTVTALIYALGSVSGCHINPAVTLALWAAKRFQSREVIGYVAAQLAGGIIGAGLLLMILNGKLAGHFDVAASGLGQNGWGAGYLGQYSVLAAFVTDDIPQVGSDAVRAAFFEGMAGLALLGGGLTLFDRRLGQPHGDRHDLRRGLFLFPAFVALHRDRIARLSRLFRREQRAGGDIEGEQKQAGAEDSA